MALAHRNGTWWYPVNELGPDAEPTIDPRPISDGEASEIIRAYEERDRARLDQIEQASFPEFCI
jgi:hypothetical protein